MSGKFIVVEGLEGAGKTNACQVVAEVLQQQQKQVVFTREPGGTPVAEQLRQLIKHSLADEPLQEKAELLMIYAARVQLLENVIKPALQRGCWVIGDRHDLSTQAYQGGGRGIDQQVLRQLSDFALAGFQPAMTLYLDIDPQIGLARARARGELDRIEQEALSFFQRIRQHYLQLAQQQPHITIIDAAQPLAVVSEQIRVTVQQWLAQSA